MVTKEDVKAPRSDMDGRFGTVLDAIGERFESVDAELRDDKRRIIRLEQ